MALNTSDSGDETYLPPSFTSVSNRYKIVSDVGFDDGLTMSLVTFVYPVQQQPGATALTN